VTLSDLARAWASWMGPAVWQATILAAALLVLDALVLRRAWPHVRAACWLLLFVKLALPPSLASPMSVTAGLPAAPAAGGAPVGAMLAWAVGAAALGATAVLRARASRARMLREASEPAAEVRAAAARAARRLGLRRVPRVVVSPAAKGPCVFGAWRPVVALPPAAPPGVSLDHVLLHEFAHVRRGDLVVHAALTVLQIAYWFHPLLWIARRRIAALREICCDATVASRLGEETPSYRRTLARAAAAALAPQAGLGIFASQATLIARLHWLDTRPWRNGPLRRGMAAAVALALAACVLPMARPGSAMPPAVRAAYATIRQAFEGRPGVGCMRVRHAVLFLNSQALKEENR